MAIQESIELDDRASGTLEEIAGAADDATDALDALRDASADVDSGTLEDASDALEDVTSAAEDASDAVVDVGSAATDAGDEGASAFEGMGEAIQSLNAGAEVIGKIGKGVAKVAQLAYAFGAAVVEAHQLREAATGALDAVTGGRGAEALEHLSGVADQLGISVQDASAQFVELRNAGASAADAEGLIKLRADLLAVGVDAGTADAAVQKALDGIKRGGDAGDVIAGVAEGFGAVGDGANASARRALTLSGALDNIQNAGARAFDSIAEAAGPALDAAGAKITSVLDSLEDSGAIEAFAAGFADAVAAIPPIIDGMLEAWDSFRGAIEPGLIALDGAFIALSSAMGDAEGGMSTGAAVGQVLGAVFNSIAFGISSAVGAVAAFVDAANAVVDAATFIIDTVSGIPDALASIDLGAVGSNLVASFIAGMESMVSSVIASASGLGDAAGDAIKSALGIASPSKVGLEIGENVGGSVEMGLDASMPEDVAVPTFADVLPAPVANEGAPSSPAGGATIQIGQMTIEVYAAAGQSPEDIARAVWREFERRVAA